jgi:asparagine N-glycosylation enzyme membrane subunit Stt3
MKKENMAFWAFVAAVSAYGAFNLVQYINTGNIFRVYLLAAAVMLLIVGIVFLSPFTHKGKTPFESKLEDVKR